MDIHLIAIGNRMPAWIRQGYDEYARRLTGECRLQLHEVPAVTRGRHPAIGAIREEEGRRLLGKVPQGAWLVALDEQGKVWDSQGLARQIQQWRENTRAVALLVGGPDGLDAAVREEARQLWSLSPLTLPHPLVRVILAEQLYRAWSILRHHPYHRA